ncbi:transcription factor AIG1-like isoform X2 [Macadamia integrifolia]|uniref:transcription factor AIG1-like isoform X2 n=1 Tax=Macadamia integrifolia TaxID=60698 RepID=UPI001C4E3B56|nr:transcription factor AIG1-like isoform X2 [Macadamia integrifolia]
MDKCLIPKWPEEAPHHPLNRRPFGGLAWPPPPLPYTSTSLHAHHSFPFSSISAEATAEDRATAASKSHSQAEKRRRERINAHLATLRKLIPQSDKMDKATLLGSVIEHAKDLKTRAAEISKTFLVPNEVDEVTIDDCEETPETMNNNKEGNIFIKASICSEDRPELFMDIIEAIKGLKLTTVKADMATVGGRVINIMILSAKNYDKGSNSLNSLKQTLKVVLTRIASSPAASMNARASKRQKILLPSYYSDQSHSQTL